MLNLLASALLAGFVRLPCSCPDGGVVVRGLSWLGGIRRPPTIESPGPVLTLKVPLPQRAWLSHILCNYPGELARKYDRFKVLPVLDVEGTPGAPVPFRCSSGTRPPSRPCPRRLGRGGAAAPGNHSRLGDNSAAEIPKSSPEPRRSSASERLTGCFPIDAQARFIPPGTRRPGWPRGMLCGPSGQAIESSRFDGRGQSLPLSHVTPS